MAKFDKGLFEVRKLTFLIYIKALPAMTYVWPPDPGNRGGVWFGDFNKYSDVFQRSLSCFM
jgi:hypothetical protein